MDDYMGFIIGFVMFSLFTSAVCFVLFCNDDDQSPRGPFDGFQ